MSKKANNPLAVVEASPDGPAALATPDLIAQINEGHRLVSKSAKMAEEAAQVAAHNAVIVGLMLANLKARTPHGGWESLFSNSRTGDNKPNVNHGLHFEFSHQTAFKYIKAAEGALARPGLPAATRKRLLAIAGAEEMPAMNETLIADLNTATRGDTLRKLYIDLGIVKGDAIERGTLPPGKTGKGAGKGGDTEPPAPTPEEEWEALFHNGLSKVDRFFVDRRHLRLPRERVTELRGVLAAWKDQLDSLKF